MPRVWSSPTFLLVLCLAAFASLTFARSVRNRNPSNRNRNRQEGNTHQEMNNAHSLLCPSVVCAPLPDTCQTSEYIVVRVPFTTNSGQRAEVRCQSCEYCLDLPSESSDAAGRVRRSPIRPRHHQDCTRVTCPDVTSHCADVRQTDVLLGNTVCKQCPACYDVTVFDRT